MTERALVPCVFLAPEVPTAQGRGGREAMIIYTTPEYLHVLHLSRFGDYKGPACLWSFHISLFMSFLLSSGNYFRPAPAQARRHQQRSGWFRSKATAGLGTWWKPPSHARQRTRAVAQRMTWTILHRHTQRLPLGTQLLLQEVGRPSTSTCNHALRARPALMV
jgi:hypothetical protein